MKATMLNVADRQLIATSVKIACGAIKMCGVGCLKI